MHDSSTAKNPKYRMAMGYLYLNACLYLLFAIWCTAAPLNTSRNLGYWVLSKSGNSEYLVIYGGLQVGLAFIFYLMARHAAHVRLGLKAAIGLYAPIVVYRAVTVASNWPVGGITLATALLESLLLIGAVWFHYKLREQA